MGGHAFLTEGIASEEIIYVIRSGAVAFTRSEDPCDDPACEFGRIPQARSKESLTQVKPKLAYDLLSEGDVFCSLAALPISAYEPLSAVVTTPECTVFYSKSPRFGKLPKVMLSALRAHMMQGLVARLQRVRGRAPDAFMPPLQTQEMLRQTAMTSEAAWTPNPSKRPKRGGKSSGAPIHGSLGSLKGKMSTEVPRLPGDMPVWNVPGPSGHEWALYPQGTKGLHTQKYDLS